MISLIVRGFLKIIDLAAWVLAKLIVTLGLWVAILYSVIFFAVCVAQGIPFGGVLGVYFIGLIISVIGPIFIKMYIGDSRRKKAERERKRAAASVSRVRLKNEDYEPPPQYRQYAPQQQPYTAAEYAAYERRYFESKPAPPPARDYREELLARSAAPINGEITGGYEPPSDNILNRGELLTRLEPGRVNPSRQESPLIFRTRRDPGIIIYEYSDRLQFYRKQGNGLVLLSTEYKD